MHKREYMTITITHRVDGNIDYVLRRDSRRHVHSMHNGIDVFFNVSKDDWLAWLNELNEAGWELVNLNIKGEEETRTYKRMVTGKMGG